MAIIGDFEKKLDNFEKCYHHFCFTNLVTQYCSTSVCHGLGPFVWFFWVFPTCFPLSQEKIAKMDQDHEKHWSNSVELPD